MWRVLRPCKLAAQVGDHAGARSFERHWLLLFAVERHWFEGEGHATGLPLGGGVVKKVQNPKVFR
jgi:hypothetical protein